MTKTELRQFELRFGEETPLSCQVPCTLLSVLSAEGKIPDPRVGLHGKGAVGLYARGCEFSTVVRVDETQAAARHLALRFSGVLGCATLFIDGNSAGTFDNANRTFLFDVKGAMPAGEHTVTLRFAPGEEDRHPAAQDGGAYAPALRDCGIVRRVELLSYDDAVIDRVRIRQLHEEGCVTLHIGVETIGTAENIKAVATLTSPGGRIYYSGLSGGHGTLIINDPTLWWPAVLGTPALYQLRLTLYADNDVADETVLFVGLRTVTVERGNGERPGRCFVNGVPVMLFCADFAPEDRLLPACERKAERLIRAGVRMGIHMFRIPEDMWYPSEEFLSLCDRHGVMLWQDLLPFDSLNANERRRGEYLHEIAENLPRMAAHPCFALCARFAPADADVATTVRDAAPDVPFAFLRWVPDGKGAERLEDITDTPAGTPVAGFLSQRPPVSMPDIVTSAEFLPPEERNLFSETMEYHAGDKTSLTGMLTRAEGEYFCPSGWEEQTYLSQLTAGEAVVSCIENVRTARADHSLVHIGTFHDTWGAPGQTFVDAAGRRKLPYYMARRALSPVLLTLHRAGYRMGFSVSNETQKTFEGTLTYTLSDAANGQITTATRQVRVDPGTTPEVWSVDFSTLVFGHEREYYLSATLTEGSLVTAQATSLFVRQKHFRYLPPELHADIRGSGRDFEMTLTAGAFAHAVELRFDGMDAVFEDNGFDITRPTPYRICFSTAEVTTAGRLQDLLRLRSAYGIGRE